MSFPLLSALLALAAAAAWGSGDFTSGLASRRVGAFYTVLISYSVGLFALIIVAAATHEAISSPADMLWGALAGLSGWVGLGFLLRGFTVGRMGIVAPISASVATAIPFLFTAFTVGLPGELQLLGFVLALVGIWLLSRPESLGGRPSGIGMALLAGAGFGCFFTALDQISASAVYWPLVAGRLVCCALMVAYVLITRRTVSIPRSLLLFIVLAGMLDVSGNLFFLLAVQAGRLDVGTVLSSLYPAVTTLLAWLIARERITRLQGIGVAAAVTAIVLITL